MNQLGANCTDIKRSKALAYNARETLHLSTDRQFVFHYATCVSPQQTIHTLSFYLFILYFIIISTFVSNYVVQTIIYDNQTQVYVLY